MTNLEIKARCDLGQTRRALKKFGAQYVETLRQIDTYFNVREGRLKLRDQRAHGAYLIFYRRAEKTSRRWSHYHTLEVADARATREFLGRALGVKVEVDKRRVLYRFENARVHLDMVAGLGTFWEIEVEVERGPAQARRLMGELLQALEIAPAALIKKSYSDLIKARR